MGADEERMARETPALSIVCAGARPHSWKLLCDTLAGQTVPFEIVMVGPTPPVMQHPAWFHWHYATVKPQQARMAAATLARGKLLMHFNDDWLLRQPDSLGRVVREWESMGDPLALAGCAMGYPYLSFASTGVGPKLPFAQVFERTSFLARGGWDTRFIAVYGEDDLAIERQQQGHGVKIVGTQLDEVIAGNMWDQYWEWDRALIDWWWMDGYEVAIPRERTFDNPLRAIRTTRRDAVQGYNLTVGEQLFYQHQGPHGKWEDTCKACWKARTLPCTHVPPLPPDGDLQDWLDRAPAPVVVSPKRGRKAVS